MISLWWAVGMTIFGTLNGWFMRVLWEHYNPRYIIVPDLDETRDNTAALQRAVDLAARLHGRIKRVDVRPGTFATGTIELGGE